MDMNATVSLSSLDDLLDGTLDDLKDMPAFKVFPAGAHKCKITWGTKEISGQQAPEIKLTLLETLELTDPNAVPAEVGDECSMAFLFKNKDGTPNEYAQGGFKAILTGLKKLVPEGTAVTPRAIMDASNGAEALFATDVRYKDKKDPNSAQYLNIKEVLVE